GAGVFRRGRIGGGPRSRGASPDRGLAASGSGQGVSAAWVHDRAWADSGLTDKLVLLPRPERSASLAHSPDASARVPKLSPRWRVLKLRFFPSEEGSPRPARSAMMDVIGRTSTPASGRSDRALIVPEALTLIKTFLQPVAL